MAKGSTGVVRERRVGMVLEPVTDLELLDHAGHAHLVLLREAVQVAQHALVHVAAAAAAAAEEEEES
nr:unnamed protein product [Digitaria exilis]